MKRRLLVCLMAMVMLLALPLAGTVMAEEVEGAEGAEVAEDVEMEDERAAEEAKTVRVYFLVNSPPDTEFTKTIPVYVPEGEALVDYVPLKPEDQNGYVFLGWTEGNGDELFDLEEPIWEPIFLKSTWEKIITVTFDENWEDGDSYPIDFSSLVSEQLPHPNRGDDWEFAGWFDNPGGLGRPITKSADFSENITVYAHWERIFYLYLEDSDIEEPLSAAAPGERAAFELPEVSREGYIFQGWNTMPDGSGTRVDRKDVYWVELGENEENYGTLYAQWERIVCTVTFEGLDSINCFWGEEIRNIPQPEVDEEGCQVMDGKLYRFGGWSREEGSREDDTSELSNIVENCTFYPVWIPQVELTFQIEHGTWEENGQSDCTVTMDEGASLEAYLPTAVAEREYMAEGSWQPELPEAAENGTFRFTCRARERYEIALEGMEPITALEGLPFELPTPMKTGWDFLGWYTGSGKQITGEKPATGDMELFPKWEKTYSLSFDLQEGEGGPKELTKTTQDTTITSWTFRIPATKPRRDGYDFQGWCATSDGTGTVLYPNEEITVDGQTQLYALWEKQEQTFVLHYDSNCDLPDLPDLPDDVHTDTTDTWTFTVTSQTLQREGYDFLGWNTDKNATTYQYFAGQPFTVGSGMTGGKTEGTLYAIWKKWPERITLNFVNFGLDYATKELIVGQCLGENMPPDPVRQGYKFLGWNTKEDGTGKTITADTPLTASMRIYAQWQEDGKVKVSIQDSGVERKTYRLSSGDTIGEALPEPFPKEGYRFLGWESQLGPFTSETPITQDLVIRPKWEKITRVTVKFLDRGEEVFQLTLDVGAQLGHNMPEDPSREGWRFLDWNTREDGTGKRILPSTPIREDTTLYAQWEEIQYVIVRFLSRGQELDSVEVEEGKKLGDAMPDNPTRQGYSFKGWNQERDGSGVKFYKSTTVYEDMEVHAQWAIRDRRNPKTGDSLSWAAAVLCMSGLCLGMIFKKRVRG